MIVTAQVRWELGRQCQIQSSKGMTIEEELAYLREEKKVLPEQLMQRDELIEQQELLVQQNALIQQHGEQMSSLCEQMKALQDRLAKDSHHSHLPVPAPGDIRSKRRIMSNEEKIWGELNASASFLDRISPGASTTKESLTPVTPLSFFAPEPFCDMARNLGSRPNSSASPMSMESLLLPAV